MPMHYTEISSTSVKIENYIEKKMDIFNIFAQNIDCGYTLEPSRRGGSNEYPPFTYMYVFDKEKRRKMVFPCTPQFHYIKVGFMWGMFFIEMFS